MTDIVERANALLMRGQAVKDMIIQQADTIATLRADLAKAVEGLEPFAREARLISDAPDLANKSWGGTGLSYGDFRRAQSCLPDCMGIANRNQPRYRQSHLT